MLAAKKSAGVALDQTTFYCWSNLDAIIAETEIDVEMITHRFVTYLTNKAMIMT